MTQMRWVGTFTFNEFVLFAVITGDFNISVDKELSSVIQTCLTICTDHKHPLFMQKTEVGKRWADIFEQLNLNRDFVDKTGMTNTITHCSNEYMVSVKNYLVYGLWDNYIRLLRS